MNSSAFTILKKAFKSGEFNEDELKKIKAESNPLISEQIDYVLKNVNLSIEFDTGKFSFFDFNKDELVITFLLFIGKTLNMQKLKHTFITPYSDSIYNWLNLFKLTTFSVLSLMYDKKWTNEEIFMLDEMVLRVNEGHADAVRKFMENIKLVNKSEIYDAEKYFIHNRRLTADKFGPFYWRLLHLMAEAVEIRRNQKFPKSLWKEFVVYILYRTLRCSICEEHYKSLIPKFKNEVLESDNFVKVMFNIHNEVNIQLGLKPYSEDDFQKDRELMKKML